MVPRCFWRHWEASACLQLSWLGEFSSWLTLKKCLQVFRTSLHAMSRGQSPKPLFSHMTAQAPKRSKSSTLGEVLGNLSVWANRRAFSGFSWASMGFFPLKNLPASTVRVRKSSGLWSYSHFPQILPCKANVSRFWADIWFYIYIIINICTGSIHDDGLDEKLEIKLA